MHNYEPDIIETPLKSGVLEQNLGKNDFSFITKNGLDKETIKPLLDASHYLSLKTLEAVCICVIATEFFVGREMDSIKLLKEKLNITDDLTLEIVE